MGIGLLEIFLLFQCGDRLYTLETDVHRRQILTYKDGPRAERVDMSKLLHGYLYKLLFNTERILL